MNGRAPRSNYAQMEALVKCVEDNNVLYLDNFPGPDGRRARTLVWEKVAEELNQMGPTKTGMKWRDAWKDLKARVRKQRKAQRRIPNSVPPLTPLEKKVEALIGAKTSAARESHSIKEENDTVMSSGPSTPNSPPTDEIVEMITSEPQLPPLTYSEPRLTYSEPQLPPRRSERKPSHTGPGRTVFTSSRQMDDSELPDMDNHLSAQELLAQTNEAMVHQAEIIAHALRDSANSIKEGLFAIAQAMNR